MPELVVLGASPVAEALAELAPHFHWSVTRTSNAISPAPRLRVTVVATQGQGDMNALKSALSAKVNHIAFVGSKKKFAALSQDLKKAAFAEEQIAGVSAPAGLDIGAVTPEEIALSILAELIQVRRTAFGTQHD